MVRNLQHYNRVFLIKQGNKPVRQELYLATRRVIDKKTWDKRESEYREGDRMRKDLWEHDEDALHILTENGLDLNAHNQNPAASHHKDEAKTQKIRTMPQNQHVAIYNQSIIDLPDETAIQMIDELDMDAYTDILEQTFGSWSNL